MSDKNFDLKVGSLVLFSKKVRDEFVKLKEQDKLYIQGLKWLGFKHTYVSVEHDKRYLGESTYTLSKLINLAIQGWISNSEKLLFISIKLGLLFTLCSFFVIISIKSLRLIYLLVEQLYNRLLEYFFIDTFSIRC